MYGMVQWRCSWLRKLEVTKQLLVDEEGGSLPDDEALAYAFIYLQVIQCKLGDDRCCSGLEAWQLCLHFDS